MSTANNADYIVEGGASKPVHITNDSLDITTNISDIITVQSITNALPAGESHLGNVGGILTRAYVEIATTASQGAYIAGDAVLKNGGGLSEVVNVFRLAGGSGYITGIRIVTDKKSIAPRFKVHGYNVSNPTISADNAPWQDKYADVTTKKLFAQELPAMTTPLDTTNSDCSIAQDMTIRVPITGVAGATSIWIGLEAIDVGFTPANSEKFYVILYIDQN